jgi:hypothetical protein
VNEIPGASARGVGKNAAENSLWMLIRSFELLFTFITIAYYLETRWPVNRTGITFRCLLIDGPEHGAPRQLPSMTVHHRIHPAHYDAQSLLGRPFCSRCTRNPAARAASINPMHIHDHEHRSASDGTAEPADTRSGRDTDGATSTRNIHHNLHYHLPRILSHRDAAPYVHSY